MPIISDRKIALIAIQHHLRNCASDPHLTKNTDNCLGVLPWELEYRIIDNNIEFEMLSPFPCFLPPAWNGKVAHLVNILYPSASKLSFNHGKKYCYSSLHWGWGKFMFLIFLCVFEDTSQKLNAQISLCWQLSILIYHPDISRFKNILSPHWPVLNIICTWLFI